MIRQPRLMAALLLASSLLSVVFAQNGAIPGCDSAASARAVPAPWYTMPIASNPSAACGGTTCNYGWRANDPADTPALQAIHTNMITLAGGAAGTNSQYINLTQTTGINSVGTTLPGPLFTDTAGNIQSGTAGWSFEVTFKATTQRQWGKIFDLGNGNAGGCNDDIVFGWTDTNQRTEFSWCNSEGGENKLLSWTTLALNTWYHVVIVVQQFGNAAGNGQANLNFNSLWWIYINGQSYGVTIGTDYHPSARPAPYPVPNVVRSSLMVGKSNWNDAYWAGSLRHFNIYNNALTAGQVDSLYRNRMGASCTLTTGATSTSGLVAVPSYSDSTVPSPIWQMLGNTAPSNADGIHYGWMQADQADVSCGLSSVHSGLIVLGGTYDESHGASSGGAFIDLYETGGPNSISQSTPLPNIGGDGSGDPTTGTQGWTLELIMKPLVIETWAKVFDFSNEQVGGRCRNDILAGVWGNGPDWTFQTCDSNGIEYNTAISSLKPGVAQWTHALFVMQKQTNGNATYLVYQNGELMIVNPSQYYPEAVERINAYLGKSSWGADFFWDGYIDYFNIYDRAFTAPQAQAKYRASMQKTDGSIQTYCPVPNNPRTDLASIERELLFSATFDSNPSAACGGAACNYQWVQTLSSDSTTDRALHTGLLELNPGNIVTHYVNLSESSGPRSIGKVFDTEMLGGQQTSGSVWNGTAGFSIEVTWKAQGQTSWGKLFDIGAIRPGSGCNYDIYFGWHANDANDLDFQICNYWGDQYGPSPFTQTFGTLNVWHHFVAVVAQLPNGMANYTIYFDGAQVWAGTNLYYPSSMKRPNALLGDSNWADPNWQGYVDTFNVYRAALAPAQVQTIYTKAMIPSSLPQCDNSASRIPLPLPWFSLNVSSDPRAAAGGADVAGYGWTMVDVNDSPAAQAVHNGMIVLGGGASTSTAQFINLATTTGPNTVGWTFDGFIGGSGQIDALASRGTAGWTFEVTVKPTGHSNWAKIFDFSNPQAGSPLSCRDDILLGWNGATRQLQFDYCDGRGNQNQLVSSFELAVGQWYHIVVVIQQLQDTTGSGTASAFYLIYINNVLAGSAGGALPTSVRRANSMIGRSSWPDPYFQGMLDSLNLYQYALAPQYINALYLNKMGGCSGNFVNTPINFPNTLSGTPAPFVDRSVPSAAPSPLWSLPTETMPPNANSSDTNFGWLDVDPEDALCGLQTYHRGLITLGGSSNPGVEGPYINLTATSGARAVGAGEVLPVIGGNGAGDVTMGTRGWSFEFVVKPKLTEQWSKLFDFGNPHVNGVCRDDILTGWEGWGPEWTFTVCDDNGRSYDVGNAFNDVNVTDWLYGTIVIQQSTDGTANYYTYANGRLIGALPNAYYPTAKSRYNGFLGRSAWTADSYWDGYVDTFNIYAYALSPAQVLSLYNGKTGNGQAPTTCVSSGVVNDIIDPNALILDLTFDSDPRQGAARYGWMAVDNNDTATDQSLHKGILTLAGGRSHECAQSQSCQYINLTEQSGPTSLPGQFLNPWAIGDNGHGDENLDTAGWTWEITFKPTLSSSWGKLFDFGGNRPSSGSCRFDLLFGQFGGSQRQYSFSACDQGGGESGLRPAIATIEGFKWHHVVLVIELGPQGQGIYRTYLNGVRQPLMEEHGWFPTVLPRVNGLIGRSNWDDDYWAGQIDTFRIYSVAATSKQADTMYKRMLDPTYNPEPNNGSSSSSLSGGAIAGIVIGSIAGAIILLAVLAVVCCGLGGRGGKKSGSSDYGKDTGASHRFDEMEASRNVEMSQVQGETHDNESETA